MSKQEWIKSDTNIAGCAKNMHAICSLPVDREHIAILPRAKHSVFAAATDGVKLAVVRITGYVKKLRYIDPRAIASGSQKKILIDRPMNRKRDKKKSYFTKQQHVNFANLASAAIDVSGAIVIYIDVEELTAITKAINADKDYRSNSVALIINSGEPKIGVLGRRGLGVLNQQISPYSDYEIREQYANDSKVFFELWEQYYRHKQN